MRRFLLIILFIFSCGFVLFNCNQQQEEKSPYKNIASKEAHYVGMETCKTCHLQVYETFIKTGMGQSWGLATQQKSAADFSPQKALVYDTVNDLFYKPFWDGDSLSILEYRMLGNDTIHKRLEKVSYIVGSGQHTNSHIININGYLHQAPITFYTQKGKWDLAPGFEKGSNTRFDRKIEMECISCHNGYPDFVEGSLNKYNSVKLGIDCERCHGPGSIHVAEKQQGDIVDTSHAIDYSIVNPKKLSTEAQNNLCQRCHLQGVAVLNDSKSFFDFNPSEKLSKTMNVFMPVYSGDEQNMIMASHVERMKMSNCYVNSGKMSCITCHNPHVSVKFTPQQQYINACQSCHEVKNKCSEKQFVRAIKKDNCIECHMPKNGSIDIPHVAVTDHYIRRRPIVENKHEVANFIQMKCYNQDSPNARTRARAFMEFFERYEAKSFFLDSALMYLQKAGVDNTFDDDVIRVYHLQNKPDKIIELLGNKSATEIKYAWTAYRIGEAFTKTKNNTKALAYLQQAATLKPLYLDFQNKLGDAYINANDYLHAKQTFDFILKENVKYAAAHASLGYIAMQEKKLVQAKMYFQQAIMLNPNDSQSMINLAVVYYQLNEKAKIVPLLKALLKHNPQHEQAKAMLDDLE